MLRFLFCRNERLLIFHYRSSRTNPQVEKDNIAKAVRNATAAKQAEVEKARAELGNLGVELQGTQAQLTKQSQISNQWDAVVKEKEKTITFLDKKLFDVENILNETNNVLSKTSAELQAARQSTPDTKLLRDLEEERMESQHLKDRMESVATLLQELTMQLMV
jgi:chromosome segregation ATPase